MRNAESKREREQAAQIRRGRRLLRRCKRLLLALEKQAARGATGRVG